MRVLEAETMAAEQETLPALDNLVHKVQKRHDPRLNLEGKRSGTLSDAELGTYATILSAI